MDTSKYPTHPHPRGYVVHRASSPLSLNGKLDDADWKAAPWSEEFLDILGPSAPTPWHATRVKMLWDDDGFYIGAWLDEPKPWASLTLHDSIIFKDNDFEVFLDPDGDNWLYYEVEVNALATIWDLFLVRPYRDGGPPIMNWETIAPSEATQADGPTGWKPMRRAVWVDGTLNDGTATSRGWSVEMAFPWSLLKQAAGRDCPPKPGDQWRINFSRVQWSVTWDEATKAYVKTPADQHENNWVWSPQWEVNMHKPEMWGYAQFSSVPAVELATTQQPESFVPDASWPLRSFLMELYYAQKDLGLAVPSEEVCQQPRLQTTEVGFLAGAQLALPSGQLVRYYVNEESRITSKEIKTMLSAPTGQDHAEA